MDELDIELDQATLLGNKKETESFAEVKKVESSKKPKDIPFGYITINLDSMGKLHAPMTLHFRDFSLDELTHISLSKNPRDNIKRITECLNKMILENFDCSYLHMNEALQITYTLFGSFVSSTIEKEYYIDPTLPEGDKDNQLDNSTNIGTANISIKNIKTKQLSDNFTEPFDCSMEIQGKNMTTLFRLLRIKDIIEAEAYVNKHFEKEIRKLSNIELKINEIKELDSLEEKITAYNKLPKEEIEEYEFFMEQYNTLYISVLTSMPVVQVGSEKPITIEDHISCAKKINRGQWKKYHEWMDTNNFGLLPDIEFYSMELQDTVTRRFPFQPNDFIDTSQ